MSTINEQIVTGRAKRVCIDKAAKLWQRISEWTKASDIEFNDAKTAETKVGAIDGITDSLASTSSRIAASAKSVNQLSNNLATTNTNLGKVRIYVGTDKKLHFVNSAGADTALNFNNIDIVTGTFTYNGYVTGVNTEVAISVPFGRTFNKIPTVYIRPYDVSGGNQVGVKGITNVTKSSFVFTFAIGNNGEYTPKLDWIAY